MVKLVTIRTYFRSRSHWRSSMGQLFAGPVDGLGGGGVEAIQRPVGRAILVVVALHDGDVHLSDDFEALFGIGIVADHIAQAGVMGALLLLDILQNDRERLEIGVNVGYDCKLHSASTLQFQTRERRPWVPPR